MPIRKQDYHPDWKRISLAVRQEAGNCCEWCHVPNHQVIRRNPTIKAAANWTVAEPIPGEDLETMTWRRLRFHGLTRVVLSVAHLDRNSRNNERGNLVALCQRCHLRYDVRQHVANRRYGRGHGRVEQLKIEIY